MYSLVLRTDMEVTVRKREPGQLRLTQTSWSEITHPPVRRTELKAKVDKLSIMKYILVVVRRMYVRSGHGIRRCERSEAKLKMVKLIRG